MDLPRCCLKFQDLGKKIVFDGKAFLIWGEILELGLIFLSLGSGLQDSM